MLIGLVIFAVASATCGLATDSLMLNLSRAAQGVGGAFLVTASLAILSNAFTGAERNQAFAFWGASLGIALAVGPIIGGAITNFVGWRWAFLVNVPASAVLILATLKFIGESRDPNAKRLDISGTVTFSAGLALLIWALIDVNEAGWASSSIVIRLAAAFVFLAAFVIVELRQDRPMVEFGLFRRRTFLGAVLAMIGYGASAQVMIFFLPLYLENAYGFEATAGGHCDDSIRSTDGAGTKDHAPTGDTILRPVFACRWTCHYCRWQCRLLVGWPVSPALWGISCRDGDRRLWCWPPERADREGAARRGARGSSRDGFGNRKHDAVHWHPNQCCGAGWHPFGCGPRPIRRRGLESGLSGGCGPAGGCACDVR
jgi:hypothetical protein